MEANAGSAADSEQSDRKRLPLLLVSGFLQHAVGKDFVSVSIVL